MTSQTIAGHDRVRLTQLASDSISHGIRQGSALDVNLQKWPANLGQVRSSFVTLQLRGSLRGCIGSLQAVHPLARDVALHAFGAAFRDPRFPALATQELQHLDIHISVLSAAVPMQFASELDLLEQLRPGVDGLVLQEGAHRATFLPDVWQNLPDPVQFLSQLKLKAGLSRNHWSSSLTMERYTTESW